MGEKMKNAGRKKKVFLCATSKTCNNLSYQGTQIYEFLRLNHIKVTKSHEEADVIIVNTCGFVTPKQVIAEKIVQFFIDKYQYKKRIIISGCLPKIDKKYNYMEEIITIGPTELNKFNNIFDAKIPISKVSVNKINPGFIDENDIEDKYLYFIEICTGCVWSCSYCAIKLARGNIKSKPINDIIAEFHQGLKKGANDFMLLADDCASYGLDLGLDFADLINSIANIPGNFSIRIPYFYPLFLEKLYPKIKSVFLSGKISFLNIPLQTSSERILKLMNRKYNINNIMRIVSELKEKTNIKIMSHAIFCFPTETRQEFLETLDLMKKFDQVYFLQYSKRPGTRAAQLDSSFTKEEILFRTNYLKKRKFKVTV